MKVPIRIFLLFFIFSCETDEDEVVPDYEIYPIVEVTSPLFGYSDIETVTSHIYAVVNNSVDTLQTDHWDIEPECSKVVLAGKRIPYEYPAVIVLDLYLIIPPDLRHLPFDRCFDPLCLGIAMGL